MQNKAKRWSKVHVKEWGDVAKCPALQNINACAEPSVLQAWTHTMQMIKGYSHIICVTSTHFYVCSWVTLQWNLQPHVQQRCNKTVKIKSPSQREFVFVLLLLVMITAHYGMFHTHLKRSLVPSIYVSHCLSAVRSRLANTEECRIQYKSW